MKRKAGKGLKKAQAALTRAEDGSDTLSTMLAEMNAEQKKREEIEARPPEVFLRARELRKKGKFERRIAKRTPKNLYWDTVEFECGHKTEIFEHSTSTKRECSECLEAWLRRHGKKEGVGAKKRTEKKK